MIHTILLVEDDLSLINTLSFNFKSLGFQVYIAHAVREAITMLLIYKIHIIISDIMMHDLSGYDLIKILKLDNRLIKIPLIFLTAKGMTYDRIRGYNLGCHAYITKPFNPSELIAIIKTIINNNDINSRVNAIYRTKNRIDKITKFNIFTEKEERILFLVIQGYTNKEVSIKLKMNLRNVEKYISKLLYKSNARNRTHLVQIILTSHYIF